ncbi:LysR family transcriptional regulator [Ancylobacter sp. A5.8]|uniref:LysR family transcriptional regulator n=1 Tax=Ancylobacter gelatini TaxID=2919920 RepID=UPI001F4E969A|nr:LysR family transcriptional regulator [Ancylobacter gelatini]MCJ8143412.1 LysR family transcriptional regulator [Ancylobacter gelatini]
MAITQPPAPPGASSASTIHQFLRRVDITSLRLFVAICEEGSLTKAARREGIAASAVSKRLSDLEEILAINLFDRMAKGMVLTPAGETLLHHARATMLGIEKMGVELSEYSIGVRGHVRMFANLSAIVQFLPEDLPSFLEKHSLLRLDLQERPSTEVVTGIAEGAADIGICSGDVENGALEICPYRRDHLVVVMRPDHPLAARERLHFEETLAFDHIGLHPESSIYRRSHYAASLLGRKIRLRVHVPGFDAVCRMVQANMGIALIPDRSFDILGGGMNLRAIPLSDPWAARQLQLLVREGRTLPSAARLMYEHLKAAAIGDARPSAASRP